MQHRWPGSPSFQPDLDLTQSAFIYIDQHRHARRVLEVPFAELDALADEVPAPAKIIFIFSIGRCGSTLVSHMLSAVPGVLSLSEPIVYARLIMDDYNRPSRLDFPRHRLIRLIRACTRLLFRPPAGATAHTIAIKLHSQPLFQASLYREAFPQAAHVFLYREALGWAKSWFQMVRKYGVPPVLTGEKRTLMWSITTAVADVSEAHDVVDFNAEVVPVEDGLIAGWARNMQEYMHQLKAGVPFLALSYHQINDQREATVARLLHHCGLPESAATGAMVAYEKDSQEGTMLSREVAIDGLGDAQVERLRVILARHPTYRDPSLVLPDIYTDGAG